MGSSSSAAPGGLLACGVPLCAKNERCSSSCGPDPCNGDLELRDSDWANYTRFSAEDDFDRSLLGMPVQVKLVDFNACGAVPRGWELTDDPVPEGFLRAGGYARIIAKVGEDGHDAVELGPFRSPMEELVEDTSPPVTLVAPIQDSTEAGVRRRHVLLALPEWSVDLLRARGLVRHSHSGTAPRAMCRLWRVTEVKALGLIVLEFSDATGKSLKEITKDEFLPEPTAQMLCRDLLLILLSGDMNVHMRLWGLLDDSMVFLGGDSILSTLVPLGFVLTFAGTSAVALEMAEHDDDSALAPEIKKAVVTKDVSIVSRREMALITDSYAIAVVIYRAVAGKQVILERRRDLGLNDRAQDLLSKMLFDEPKWRLTGRAALAHPWLKSAPDNANAHVV